MRLIRKLMIMLAVAASVFVLMPAATAQAAPHSVTICWWTGNWPIPWQCVTIEIPILVEKPEWPPEYCPVCDLAFDPWEEKINPRIAEEFLDPYTLGFSLLAESTLTEDPKEALELRGRSAEAFLKSAAVLNEYGVQLGLDRVGGYNQEKNEFVEVDNDLAVSMGKHLVEGELLMQQAELGKDPDAIVEEAMAHFDEAYADLSALYGG